ncbi:caldesmon-like [Rhopilema esculentum]|uniref:caldesmon-like n=1 Tax=Rhopilema esculentum TaxID=499914 RepID=UPI0031D658FC
MERKDVLLRDRTQRLRQRAILSKEMLQRLEAEKQRLLQERIEGKERKAAEKKERLRIKKQRKAANQTRLVEKAQSNAAERRRQNCRNTEEKLKAKIKSAKENKKEVMQTQERKLNLHRYKQIKAKLIKMEEEDRKSTFQKGSDDNSNVTFSLPMHLFSKEKREKARMSRLPGEKREKFEEESSENMAKIETYVDNSKHPFEDNSESDSEDAFWVC